MSAWILLPLPCFQIAAAGLECPDCGAGGYMSAGTSVAQLAGTYKLTTCPDFTQEKHIFFQFMCFLVFWLVYLVCVSFITIRTFKSITGK